MVRRHASSAFGRDHHFDQVRDYEGFARLVPVRTYDDLRPYIDRVVAGDPRAPARTRRQKVLMFALTSGTTAEPKYIPVTDEFLGQLPRRLECLGTQGPARSSQGHSAGHPPDGQPHGRTHQPGWHALRRDQLA